MEFVIGGIVILICLYMLGYILKKKYYKEIDRLETWKMDIVNRPVPDEMSKVKKLNMTGQTEELFEGWRNEWDEIITTQLPNVEEYLIDAEESIDKYQFRKAKKIQQETDQFLSDIEEKIKKLLHELNNLVGSEEKNRVEIEELKDLYRESKKTLLAHGHTFGKAEKLLEKQLEEIAAKFEEFENQTANGNYLEAREVVLTIHTLLDEVKYKLEVIPNLIIECGSKIPAQLSELKDGYVEMVEQGFILDHIQFEKETERIEKEIGSLAKEVENAETNIVQKKVNEIKENIESLYDLLEKEVHAKHFIKMHDEEIRAMLFTKRETNKQIKSELKLVRQSYQLPDQDLEIQAEIDNKLARLIKKYEILEHNILGQSAAHSLLKEELERIKDELDDITHSQTAFAEKLQALRKEELEARESVKELSKKVSETIRLVAKSNVPGLPQDYQYIMQDATESIQNVIDKLEEKPLNIPAVQQYLEIAVLTVEKMLNTTDEMIETIALAEKVIQYGNRYRSKYPSVENGLKEAESSFRGYDYSAALEQAAASIEEIEPGAMKKIEALLKDE